jgi:hypothetical protein
MNFELAWQRHVVDKGLRFSTLEKTFARTFYHLGVLDVDASTVEAVEERRKFALRALEQSSRGPAEG